MSKERLSLRLSENIRQEIKEIKERGKFDSEAAATREVLRRGIDQTYEKGAGERLGELSTAVGGVGAVVASLSVALGQQWADPIVVPFWTATFLFAILWASIRTLEGRDLV